MASNKVPLKGYMDGIDISAWQDTIDITKVPCDSESYGGHGLQEQVFCKAL